MSLQIPASCTECFRLDGFPNFGSLKAVPIPDEMFIELTCPRGHTTISCIQQERFEILSELSLNAFVDGYYREAVASLAASLERLYEFYLRTIFQAEGSSENFELFWKKISSQSERQLGAFIATYTLRHTAIPELLSNKHSSLRNEVVHKGRLPKRSEVIDFIYGAMRVAHPLIKELKCAPLHTAVQEVIDRRVADVVVKAASRNISSSTAAIRTFFSLSWVKFEEDVERSIEERAKQKEMYRSLGASMS